MNKVLSASDPISSKRLGQWLALSFILTIVSFLVARGISEYLAKGINTAASSISNVAAPSILHLSRARTELRHMEVLIENVANPASSAPERSSLREQFVESRSEFENEYALYKALPPYGEETGVWNSIDQEKQALDASIDSMMRRVAAGDLKGAEVELDNRTEPLFDHIDVGLRHGVDINATTAADLGARITTLRNRARTLGRVLDVLSALFAATAAFFVIRVVRRFALLMELRVSELEHFAGRVAHDIRSPLGSVSLALDLAERSQELDPHTKAVLDRGARTLQRVGQLVDGLLVFARSGAVPPQAERADVGEVVTAVVDEMLPMAHEQRIDLVLDLSARVDLACSPGVLTSLVSNLVGNALKYMGDAAVRRVEVRTRDERSHVRVEVKDTGPGIRPELRPRIFDPYVRGTDSTIPGLGLGLATVRRLAEAHGGAVGTERVTTGSLFWFEIPKAPPLPSEKSTSPGGQGQGFSRHARSHG
jgi:signal transduction histidine kinase